MPVDVSAKVVANTALSDDYNVLALEAPSIADASTPGQFLMVKAGAGHDPLLRRPFSVFEVLRDASGRAAGVSILVKRIGPSTSRLYDAKVGDRVACLGPLGQPFTLVAPPAEGWMVAGGVGLAPFWTLAGALAARGVTTRLFYGARRAAELFYLDYFRMLGVDLILTTEDGSAGVTGRVVAPLDRALAGHAAAGDVTVYACGPEGMLHATARTAASYGRRCEVSVERIMGCGMGGCYSCIVPMKKASGGFHHVRSCLSGPVLDAAQMVWD
ncbi:MAG TPA: dihydroorotate dehydrogenase electron transfer subunit [Vicinamibacterales bacterium]|nr:dihydroorotate dehydrogenase electron transfer subunit [Vicinamibacterales bacterium]